MLGELIKAGTKFLPQIASAASSLFGQSQSNRRQEDAQEFSAQQYAQRYQTQVADLKAAGLNPMLAYGQGPGSSPQSSAASAPAPGDLGQVTMQSQLNSAQVASLNASARKLNAEAAVTEGYGLEQAKANLDQTISSTGLNVSQANKVVAETANIVETLNNIKSEDMRLRRAAEMLYQQANLYSQQQLTETQKYDLVKAQAKLVISQTGLNNLDLDAAKSLGNIGRESGQLKPIIDVLLQLMQMGRPRGGGITINK